MIKYILSKNGVYAAILSIALTTFSSAWADGYTEEQGLVPMIVRV